MVLKCYRVVSSESNFFFSPRKLTLGPFSNMMQKGCQNICWKVLQIKHTHTHDTVCQTKQNEERQWQQSAEKWVTMGSCIHSTDKNAAPLMHTHTQKKIHIIKYQTRIQTQNSKKINTHWLFKIFPLNIWHLKPCQFNLTVTETKVNIDWI